MTVPPGGGLSQNIRDIRDKYNYIIFTEGWTVADAKNASATIRDMAGNGHVVKRASSFQE